jgi:molybdopterin synthase catalytic subunit
MKAHVEFTRSRIVASAMSSEVAKEIGAQVEFLGIVRELENGKPISGLFYEAHEAMARAILETILAELSREHQCEEVWLIHRLDFVPVGEASIFIRVRSRHRAEALGLTSRLIDRLKADVPIWKSH